MKILAISGTHPRHLHYFNAIYQQFGLAGILLEGRGTMLPEPPALISDHDRHNFMLHFRNRDQAEHKYFGQPSVPDCRTLRMLAGQLNSPKSVSFVEKIKPDLVLIYGSMMIREPLFSRLPRQTVNLHGGLSPRYRGSATLFWPFYFMEPTYAGCTFHYIVSEPDAGEIIHQTVPSLEKGDGIHDVGCKAIIASTEAMLELLKVFQKQGIWQVSKQRSSGKNFLQKDFRPEHLRVNYDLFDDQMVGEYLEGRLHCQKPILVRQSIPNGSA